MVSALESVAGEVMDNLGLDTKNSSDLDNKLQNQPSQ